MFSLEPGLGPGVSDYPMCDGQCLVAQSCPTLCNTLDCSPPGSSVHRDSPGKNSGVGYHAILQVCDGLEEQYLRKACSVPNPELGFGDTLISIPAHSLSVLLEF